MSEVELDLNCENCGSRCRVIYDPEQVHYEPEYCAFCGEVVGCADEDIEDETDEEDLWGDDGLSDSDDSNWN